LKEPGVATPGWRYRDIRPEETIEMIETKILRSRPFGTRLTARPNPALKRRAIFRLSLPGQRASQTIL
jgi:hypothetical protein